MTITMQFVPVPGPGATPIFIPTVVLGDDQAALIPTVGDTLTDTNGHNHSVKSRSMTFSAASVLVLIYCSPVL